jgi:hypothetical protein
MVHLESRQDNCKKVQLDKTINPNSLTHLKAASGIKSLKALEACLGYDQEAQDEAMEISE